jgi:transcription elongation GreA/GreB family factor
MSVAFRRDSDEEHREPRFELPLPAGPNYVTARGPALIADRIAALEDELEGASGDEAMEAIRRQLRYWATRRATAEVVEPPADGSAGIGCLVRIRFDGRPRAVAIVGDDEADPAADRISFSAPLARALIGAEPGDLLAFAGRDDALEVLAIEPLP